MIVSDRFMASSEYYENVQGMRTFRNVFLMEFVFSVDGKIKGCIGTTFGETFSKLTLHLVQGSSVEKILFQKTAHPGIYGR
jgi:hypothetical protein